MSGRWSVGVSVCGSSVGEVLVGCERRRGKSNGKNLKFDGRNCRCRDDR